MPLRLTFQFQKFRSGGGEKERKLRTNSSTFFGMATRARLPRAAARPVAGATQAIAVIANPHAFGAGAPVLHADPDEGDDDASGDGSVISAEDATALRDPATVAVGNGPLATFLREHMTAHGTNLDQAVEAWRLSKPSARTYKTAFRCIVRFWCQKGGIPWNAAWDKDVALTWDDLCETVRGIIEVRVSVVLWHSVNCFTAKSLEQLAYCRETTS